MDCLPTALLPPPLPSSFTFDDDDDDEDGDGDDKDDDLLHNNKDYCLSLWQMRNTKLVFTFF